MNSEDFIAICETYVGAYVFDHLDKDADDIDFDIYVVWSCKTLQNNKALLATTLPDDMYFELTYNGDKNELYLDAYMKVENRCIEV